MLPEKSRVILSRTYSISSILMSSITPKITKTEPQCCIACTFKLLWFANILCICYISYIKPVVSTYNFLTFLFDIGVQLIYNVLVSHVQQSDSLIHHVFIHFQILSPHRLLDSIECSYLCCTVGPCGLFYIQMCMLSHVWLCNPVDRSPPGSSVHGILQARILELIAIPFSKGPSRPRDRIGVSYI